MKATFSEFKIEDFLDSEEVREEYLKQVLADGDPKEFKRALEDVERFRIVEKKNNEDLKG
jgi:probable addiction module antidote protein